jgi:hypothetical protein
MTKTRTFLFLALAVVVAFGVGARQAWAADDDSAKAGIILTDHDDAPDVNPLAAAAALAGPVGWVSFPPTVGPPPSWPCIAPASPCTTDPKGGILIGVPLQQWPISGTTNCTTEECGQIMAMFETTTGTGAVSAAITIVQGTTTIYSTTVSGTTAKAKQIGVVYVTGVQLDTTAKAGAATLTVTTTIGTTKVSGKTTIYLTT